MALAYAVAVLAIVGGLVYGVTQFRSVVTHATEIAAQEVNAQAAAEAGYAAALAELQADARFRTHDEARIANAEAVSKDPSKVAEVAFGKPLAFDSRVAAAAPKYSGLERIGGGPGDYAFQVGRGLGPTVGRGFDTTFRVRVAPLSLPGYPRPLIAIESRGHFDQRTIGIVALLEAGGTTTAPASLLADYLLADGEVLDPALGEDVPLERGALYGGQGVQLTGVVLRELAGIHSGGGVWLADPMDVTFAGGAKLHAPGGDRPDPNSSASDLFDASGGRVVDHRHGGKLSLPDIAGLDRAVADKQASGAIDLGLIVAKGVPDDAEHYEGGSFIRRSSNHTNPYGPAGDAIELCFGGPAGDDPILYGKDGPALLFARGANVVVWGTPDRDVVIYTDRDLYVAGDFNREGQRFARLAARSRIWFDARHPSRTLAHELIPWIAERMAGEPAKVAKDVLFLDPASSDPVIKQAAGRAIGLLTEKASAEKLFYRALVPLEKKSQAAGLYELSAVAAHPEQTICAQLVDAATRLGDWDRGKKGKKPLPELGATYLPDNRLVQRVVGSEVHLRQLPPDPPLAISADVRAASPVLRRREMRSQAAPRFGLGGDAGLANVFRLVSRREAVANWP